MCDCTGVCLGIAGNAVDALNAFSPDEIFITPVAARRHITLCQ